MYHDHYRNVTVYLDTHKIPWLSRHDGSDGLQGVINDPGSFPVGPMSIHRMTWTDIPETTAVFSWPLEIRQDRAGLVIDMPDRTDLHVAACQMIGWIRESAAPIMELFRDQGVGHRVPVF